jgi:hypothetical protein
MYNLGNSLRDDSDNDKMQAEGKNWIIRAALLGHPSAIGWLQANDYAGRLPDPIDTQARMQLAAPSGTPGVARICLMF